MLSVQIAAGRAEFHGFPRPGPIEGADPSVTHDVEVKVPTRLVVKRSAGKVSFGIDPTGFETVKLAVGEKMVTGLRSAVRMYPEGGRPEDDSVGLDGMIRFDGVGTVTRVLPKGRSVVEIDLAIFETDVPPQHMWMPGGKKYRVLWERALKDTVGN